jgi:hypothetical protein
MAATSWWRRATGPRGGTPRPPRTSTGGWTPG